MSGGEAAGRFWDEFRDLYVAAGSPPLGALARQGTAPPGVTDSTLSEWLNRKSVPSRKRTRVFLALAAVLQARAKARSGYEPRSEGWWQRLLKAAQDERASAQKTGRPRRPGDPGPGPAGPAGWPLDDVTDPFALEVHRPVQLDEVSPGLPDLPSYVPRDHDAELARRARLALAGHSTVAVLVGGSSTGKTRACWEALGLFRGQVPGWRLWHPISPSRPEAALDDLARIGPRTVVWLNEAQEYLGAPGGLGERVAAGLRELLRDPSRDPVLVLATLWPEYWDQLTRPPAGRDDPHAQARELLAGHDIRVPEAFTPADLRQLREAADPWLDAAADGAEDGRVTQFIAGARELLARYRNAPAAARALIDAAMDARRLGMRPAIPHAFLEAAAPGYLADAEWDLLGEDWLEQALAYTAAPCKGVRGPLTRIRPRPDAAPADADAGLAYRLADYLDQHGRRTRRGGISPPSFWAAASRARPGDLSPLARAADDRGLLRDAARLYKQAAAHGDPYAGVRLVQLLLSLNPGEQAAARWAAAHAALGDPYAVASLLNELREAGAEEQAASLTARAAAHAAVGDPRAVASLLLALREAGAEEQAASLAARAAGHVPVGSPRAVAELLLALREAGAEEQAAALAARAAAHAHVGDPDAVAVLLSASRRAGAGDQADMLIGRDPAGHAAVGDPYAVASLLRALREAGAEEQAASLANRAARHAPLGDTHFVASMLKVLREAGAEDQVAALIGRDPTGHGAVDNPMAVAELLDALQAAGAGEQAAALASRAAGHAPVDDPTFVAYLLDALREAGGEDQTASLAARAATRASLGNPRAVADLLRALRRMEAEEQAAALAARAAAHAPLSDPGAVVSLLSALQEAGAEDQVAALIGRDPAGHADLREPGTVADLLSELREAGAEEQAAALAARAAAHAPLGSPMAVALLLDALWEAGAQEQVATLAARAAEQAVLGDSDDVTFREVGAKALLDMLREAGAEEQAAALIDRFPGEGLFGLFMKQVDHGERFRFGRKRDGGPAAPWGWDDLG
jgi:uncharacterized protein YidB (DUF937 family)